MSKQITNHINELFLKMNTSVDKILANNISYDKATEQIMEYVASGITSASKMYVSTIYADLSAKTLKEKIFEDDVNANKFYELNLRQKMAVNYQFDINSLDTYKNGLGYKEINRLYSTALVTVGCGSLSGILLAILAGNLELPMVVAIAGAVLAGIGGGAYTCMKAVPDKNKRNYQNAVHAFMRDLQEEMLKWVDEVELFYNQQVNELKMGL